MTSNHELLNGGGLLWDFAGRIYGMPDVETKCLKLQDDYRANINIMLWCLWLTTEKIQIPHSCLSEVLLTMKSVSEETVDKLREVRRALKDSPYFTKVQALSIKKHVLSAELVIEKVLLQRLQDLTCRFLETKTVTENDPALNLAGYLKGLECITDEEAANYSEQLELACEAKLSQVS